MAGFEISEELYEKLADFVDREAGLDVPLSPEDEAMVRDLIESDRNVAMGVESLRATAKALTSFYDDAADLEVSAQLVALIRSLKAKRRNPHRSYYVSPGNLLIH